MAITKNSLAVTQYGFGLNATSSDLSGCEELQAAPGAGRAIYLEQLSINCASAITITIGEGETAGACTSVLIGPVTFTTNGRQYSIAFERPVKLTDNTALTCDASGAGAVQIYCSGFVS